MLIFYLCIPKILVYVVLSFVFSPLGSGDYNIHLSITSEFTAEGILCLVL